MRLRFYRPSHSFTTCFRFLRILYQLFASIIQSRFKIHHQAWRSLWRQAPSSKFVMSAYRFIYLYHEWSQKSLRSLVTLLFASHLFGFSSIEVKCSRFNSNTEFSNCPQATCILWLGLTACFSRFRKLSWEGWWSLLLCLSALILHASDNTNQRSAEETSHYLICTLFRNAIADRVCAPAAGVLTRHDSVSGEFVAVFIEAHSFAVARFPASVCALVQLMSDSCEAHARLASRGAAQRVSIRKRSPSSIPWRGAFTSKWFLFKYLYMSSYGEVLYLKSYRNIEAILYFFAASTEWLPLQLALIRFVGSCSGVLST